MALLAPPTGVRVVVVRAGQCRGGYCPARVHPQAPALLVANTRSRSRCSAACAICSAYTVR